jgi:hypothetical protein
MNRISALTAMVAIVTTATLTTSAFAQAPATGVDQPQPAAQPSPSPDPSTVTPSATPTEPVTAAPTLADNCDTSAQICFDDRGISLELTRQYFGDAAANSLRQGLR